MKIGMFVATCDADWQWVAQFKKEALRLGFPVAWYGDNLSEEHLKEIQDFELTVGVFDGKDKFSEKSKGHAMRILKRAGFDWGIQMDIDETFERDAKEKIEKGLNDEYHQMSCRMITVYEDNGLYRRTDPYFLNGGESRRARFYNFKYDWNYVDVFTNGAYLCGGETARIGELEVHSVHWGYKSLDLRKEHGEKWDRVYKEAGGRNPYDTYSYLVDIKPTVEVLEDKYKLC